MSSTLDTLRDQASQLTPAQFLWYQPGCWIQYYDDTGAKNPDKALSAPTFDPDVAARKQAEHCAVCFSLQRFQGSRTKEGLVSYRNFGVDIDLVQAPERWSLPVAEIDRRKDEYLEHCLGAFPLQPHWLTETRHGFHAIYRILPVRETAEFAEAETLNRRLVHVLRGDANSALLTQVLRVPGTYQYKDPQHPFLCRLLLDLTDLLQPYPLDRVRAVLDKWDGAAEAKPGSPPRRPRDQQLLGARRSWVPMLAGVPEGQRNASAAVVVGAVLGRLPPELWEISGWGGLKEWNGRNAAPLPERELRSVYESIVRRERVKRRSPAEPLRPVTASARREHAVTSALRP